MRYSIAREILTEAIEALDEASNLRRQMSRVTHRKASLIRRAGGSQEEIRQGITGKRTPAAKSGRALLAKAYKNAAMKDKIAEAIEALDEKKLFDPRLGHGDIDRNPRARKFNPKTARPNKVRKRKLEIGVGRAGYGLNNPESKSVNDGRHMLRDRISEDMTTDAMNLEQEQLDEMAFTPAARRASARRIGSQAQAAHRKMGSSDTIYGYSKGKFKKVGSLKAGTARELARRGQGTTQGSGYAAKRLSGEHIRSLHKAVKKHGRVHFTPGHSDPAVAPTDMDTSVGYMKKGKKGKLGQRLSTNARDWGRRLPKPSKKALDEASTGKKKYRNDGGVHNARYWANIKKLMSGPMTPEQEARMYGGADDHLPGIGAKARETRAAAIKARRAKGQGRSR